MLVFFYYRGYRALTQRLQLQGFRERLDLLHHLLFACLVLNHKVGAVKKVVVLVVALWKRLSDYFINWQLLVVGPVLRSALCVGYYVIC